MLPDRFDRYPPAARVTDMLICVGPPDVIVKGSAGVFIGGLPAARIGDLTAHGGVIVVGWPTVIIGEVRQRSRRRRRNGLAPVVMASAGAGAGAPRRSPLDRGRRCPSPTPAIAGAPERRGVRQAVLRALCASGGGACRRGTRRPRRLIAGARAR